MASLHFDIFHRHAGRVVMANIAQTVNVLQAMILTHGEQVILTPTYHVFEMNKGHQDAASLPVHLSAPGARQDVGGRSLATLSMSASIKGGGALISLSNVEAAAAQSVEIELRGGDFDVSRARILTAPRLQEHNTIDHPAAVSPQSFDGVTTIGHTLRVELPAHSFATVELEIATPPT